MIGNGVTDPGAGLFSDDIIGSTRAVPWDIGAYKYVPLERYFIVASGDWDTPANWAITSGGAGGAAVPSASDDVYFDSNGGTCTLDSNASCDSMIFTGGTLDAGNYGVSLAGSISIASGQFIKGTSNVTFTSTNTNNVIDLNGQTFYDLTFAGSGGLWQLSEDLDIVGTLSINAGSFDANDFNVYETGDVYIGADGDFTKGTGIFKFNSSGVFADSGTTVSNLGKVIVGASPDTIELGSDFVADMLTINGADRLVTHGFDLDISGDIDIYGTIDASDGTGGVSGLYVEGDWSMGGTGAFIRGSSTVIFDGAAGGATRTITSTNETFYNVILIMQM